VVGAVSGRATYEGTAYLLPGGDQMRRDHVGGTLVTELADTITKHARSHNISAELIGAVIRHEGSAIERRALTPLPSWQPGFMSNAAEWTQAMTWQGETSSVGIGQIQVRRAQELESLGYVTPRASNFQRVNALLNNKSSVEYIAGMLHYLSDQLNKTYPAAQRLDSETRNRLILIGYNRGWNSSVNENGSTVNYGLNGEIQRRGFRRTVEEFGYDNQTLDEYRRWSRNRQ
jgi:hypothetical protein